MFAANRKSDRSNAQRLPIVVGVVLIALGIGTALYNLWPEIAFESGLVGTASAYPSSVSGGDAADVATDSAGTAVRPLESAPQGRRVVVPRIGVDVAVLEGDIDDALRRGTYHHVETASPGEAGNVAIAGHRTGRQFALLHRLRPGDEILLYWEGVEHVYVVEKLFGIQPQQNDVLRKGTAEKLTLYTCKPRFLGDLRTVVVARPVRVTD